MRSRKLLFLQQLILALKTKRSLKTEPPCVYASGITAFLTLLKRSFKQLCWSWKAVFSISHCASDTNSRCPVCRISPSLHYLRYNSHTAETFKELEYLRVDDLVSLNQSIFARTYSNNKLPGSFKNLLSPVPDQGVRRTRDDDYNFSLVPLKYADLHHFPVPKLVSTWNSLPLTIKSVSDLSEFRADLKAYFLSKYETACDLVNCFSCNN